MTAQTILPANTLSGGYDVANSLRLAGDAYGQKSISSSGSGTTATFSAWIKPSVTPDKALFTSYIDSNNYVEIYFSSGQFRVFHYDGGSTSNDVKTNAYYRDVTAWYHFHVIFDTTNGTEADRIQIYVNGTRVTSLATSNYPSSSQDLELSSSAATFNLAARNGDEQFIGYMAEVVWLDGTASAVTNFGEFDEDSGIWKPIDVSGLTFGTNGFYLDFEDSANLGNDANGGTDFTETGLAAIDQSTDTCTNNFCTMNPLDNYYAGSTFSEGNCRVVTGSSPETWNTSTFGLSSGKWYMEFTIIDDGSGGSTLIGIADRPTVSASEELGGLATTYAYLSSGNFRTNNSNTSNSVSATDGDIIGVALDLDSGQNTISYYKNNTLIVAAQNITAPVSGNYFIASGVWLDNDTGTTDHNFGNPVVAHSSAASDANGYGSFEYAPPSGYYAICTKNLAEYG